MSNLIKCPSCKKEVSSAATSCPGCGHPFKKAETVNGINMKDPVHVIGVVIVILMIVGVIITIGASM